MIGGTSAAEANIIGANSGNGVFLSATSTGVLVEGNYIGTDPSSDNLGNKADGVLITGNQNTIGGTAQGAGNVISGNTNNGIELAASGQTDSTKTLIEGNIIGLIASGLNILGNGNHGIFQNGADNTTIGGTSAGRPQYHLG